MTNEEKLKRLGAFVCKDKSRSFSAIMVKDGVAYASDGKILVSDALEEPCADVTTEGERELPVATCINIADEAVRAKTWYSIEKGAMKPIEDAFAETFRCERIRNDREYADRYKAVRCPSCGEDVWWDTWEDRLVEEPEPKTIVEIIGVDLPVRIALGDVRIDVNFAYLFLVGKLFGEILVSHGHNGDEKRDVLLFKTPDGNMKGVLMTLRDCRKCHIGGRILKAEEVGDAGRTS